MLLNELKITRKRTKRIVYKSQEYQSKLQIERREFLKKIKKIDRSKMVSIDESAFYPEMFPIYAYSPAGHAVKKVVTSQRQKKYSLILAVSDNKVIARETYEDSINKDIFIKFLENKLLPECVANQYFLLDNLRFHHSKEVKSLIENAGHKIIYTPPYSPDLNPVENVFSVLKRYVRQQFSESATSVKTNVINGLREIKSQTFSNFFRHAFEHDHYSGRMIEGRFRVFIQKPS